MSRWLDPGCDPQDKDPKEDKDTDKSGGPKLCLLVGSWWWPPCLCTGSCTSPPSTPGPQVCKRQGWQVRENLRLIPATGRVKPTPTSTSQFVLHLQGGALLLARTSTKRAPELINSYTRWTTGRPTLRAGQTPYACQSWWEHKRSSLRDILHCIFSQPRGKESAVSKSCSMATEPSTPGGKTNLISVLISVIMFQNLTTPPSKISNKSL